MPTNNIQVFENVSIIEQNHDYVKLAEKHLDGASETWYLEYGTTVTTNVNGQEKLCANILCDSGQSTSFIFGEAKIIPIIVRKPVISFRDFKNETEVDVEVDFNGEYDMVYPKASLQDGPKLLWKSLATANNKVIVNDKQYPYLFWDGYTNYLKNIKFEEGFCVAGKNIIQFLEQICTIFGFDDQLTAGFVTFWSPYMMKNEYNLVRWLTKKECEKLAKLKLSSKENIQIIRMYMVFEKTDVLVDIKEQEIVKIKLTDSAKIFDWGGFELN